MAAVLSRLSQYSHGFQTKVIGALLTQRQFLINIYDALDSKYFENTSHCWIIDKTVEYFDKYHTTPSQDVLATEVKKLENEILKTALIETLKEAYKAADAKDIEYIQQEFTSFCQFQQMKKAILTSTDLLEVGDLEGIQNIVNRALKSGQDKNTGMIYEKDVEQRYREDDRNPIPYPWKAFNDITQGGYGKGELILVFGNPKGGKSWTVIDMAAYAALLGYNIVYYTLELSEGYVGKRMDAYLTGIEMDQLNENKSKVESIMKNIKGKIRIKAFAAGRASLDNIESHLQQLEMNEDFKPDAIFIDYLDLLKNRGKNNREKRDDIDDVYTDARGLATERGIPLISPSQVNRAGANDDVIQADKISGSYGKIMIGDFVVSLSRKRKDKTNGTGRFHIMGNRFGPDGITFNSKINTANGHIDIDEKPMDDDFDTPKGDSNKFDDFDEDEKDYLRSKFFKK